MFISYNEYSSMFSFVKENTVELVNDEEVYKLMDATTWKCKLSLQSFN